MPQIFQVAQREIYRKEDLLRSRAYRQFVKSFPCAACRKHWGIDPCHVGPHGYGQKSSDDTCIPLCRACHRAFDANPRAFARKHKLDIPVMIERFRRLFAAGPGAMARSRRKADKQEKRNVA